MTTKNDSYFIKEALKEAEKAFNKNEVPIGAIIVSKNEQRIVSRAHNLVETKRSQTAHAEILAIQKLNKKINNWRLEDYIIYVTLEPCSMCMSLILLSRIKVVVFSAKSNLYGFRVDNCFTFESYKCPIIIKEGIGQEEALGLLKEFFKFKRNIRSTRHMPRQYDRK